MSDFTIRLEGIETLRARFHALSERDLPRGMSRALNRTMMTIRTRTTRLIAEDTGLAQKDIRPALTLQRASVRSLLASLTVSGRRIPLVAFGARQTRQGVTYRVSGGRRLVPSAFLATMRSGHRGVFKRRGRRRLPIVELFGPSLPRVVIGRRIFETLTHEGTGLLEKQLEHELAFISGSRPLTGDADAA